MYAGWYEDLSLKSKILAFFVFMHDAVLDSMKTVLDSMKTKCLDDDHNISEARTLNPIPEIIAARIERVT